MPKVKTKIKHVALSISGNGEWAIKHKWELGRTYKKSFKNLKSMVQEFVKLNIPIMTIYTLPSKLPPNQFFLAVDNLVEFFKELSNMPFIYENKVKVSVLGKWYDLPSRIVEPIKSITASTREFDSFFLNFCINYDGQEEIVDACKIIARQIKAERIDPDSIDRNTIKENLYSSYFVPPDITILTGKEKKLNSFLLWDSSNTQIYFSNLLWPDFDKTAFLKAIKSFK